MFWRETAGKKETYTWMYIKSKCMVENLYRAVYRVDVRIC